MIFNFYFTFLFIVTQAVSMSIAWAFRKTRLKTNFAGKCWLHLMSYSIFQTAIWLFLTYKNFILFIISYKKFTRKGTSPLSMTAKFRPFLVAYSLCVEMDLYRAISLLLHGASVAVTQRVIPIKSPSVTCKRYVDLLKPETLLSAW